MTDTLTELKRLHAEFIEACGPFQPYSYFVPPNEMALFALRNAFEAAAAVEIPKLLACVEAAQRALEWIEADELQHGRTFGTGNELRAALAALKGAA